MAYSSRLLSKVHDTPIQTDLHKLTEVLLVNYVRDVSQVVLLDLLRLSELISHPFIYMDDESGQPAVWSAQPMHRFHRDPTPPTHGKQASVILSWSLSAR